MGLWPIQDEGIYFNIQIYYMRMFLHHAYLECAHQTSPCLWERLFRHIVRHVRGKGHTKTLIEIPHNTF